MSHWIHNQANNILRSVSTFLRYFRTCIPNKLDQVYMIESFEVMGFFLELGNRFFTPSEGFVREIILRF